jgi:RNA polymerase sigma-70 factor (ECF subfamily)
MLNNALSNLTSRQKQVVRLRFFEGLTYEQIAAKLSMNYQSVNNLAFRAMLNLRNQMNLS